MDLFFRLIISFSLLSPSNAWTLKSKFCTFENQNMKRNQVLWFCRAVFCIWSICVREQSRFSSSQEHNRSCCQILYVSMRQSWPSLTQSRIWIDNHRCCLFLHCRLWGRWEGRSPCRREKSGLFVFGFDVLRLFQFLVNSKLLKKCSKFTSFLSRSSSRRASHSGLLLLRSVMAFDRFLQMQILVSSVGDVKCLLRRHGEDCRNFGLDDDDGVSVKLRQLGLTRGFPQPGRERKMNS